MQLSISISGCGLPISPTTRCGRGLPILPASRGAPLHITYHTIVVSDAKTEEGSWIPTEDPSHKDAAHEYKFCDLQNYSQSMNCNIVQSLLYHKMGNFDGVKIWRLRLKTINLAIVNFGDLVFNQRCTTILFWRSSSKLPNSNNNFPFYGSQNSHTVLGYNTHSRR